jgi:ribosome-binding factor A
MPSSHRSRGGKTKRPAADLGPSQRQLRAGELVRHSLADILREEEIQDPALAGVSVTVTEVRMSPDLKHATCFVEPLGAGVSTEVDTPTVVAGLNRASKFLRGRLGRLVELKFTPELKFLHDQSFDTASHMNALFARPDVARDLASLPLEGGGVGGEGERAAASAKDAGSASRDSSSTVSESAPIPGPSPFEGEGR